MFLQKLKKWSEPPVFADDPQKTSQARLMNLIGLYFLAMLGLTAVLYVPFFSVHKLESWSLVLVLAAACLVSRAIMFRGKLAASSLVIAIPAWIVLAVAVLLGSGATSPVNILLISLTLVVGLLFRTRVRFVFLAITLLLGLALAIYQQLGGSMLEYFRYTPVSTWLFLALSLVFTSLTIEVILSRLEGALEQARRENAAREQAENVLAASEARYRRLHETMQDGYAFVEMDGRLVEFNEPFRRMVGYEAPELASMNYDELTPEKWHAVERRIITEQVLARGYSEVYEKEYRRKDGVIFPVELRTFLMTDEQGARQGMWALVRDISERKRMETALQASEQRFRQMFESHQAVMLLIDPQNGAIVNANPAAAAFYGYAREALCQMKIDQINALPAEQVTLDRQRAAEGQSNYFIFPHRLANGEIRTVEVRASPIETGQGRLLFSIVQDITARQQAEERLMESEERFRTMFRALPVPTYTWQKQQDDFVLVDFNEAARLFTGGKAQYLVGRQASQVYQDEPDVLRDFASAFEGKANIEREMEIKLRSTGERKYVNAIYAYVPPDLVLAHVVDLTQRKRVEEDLRQSLMEKEALLRELYHRVKNNLGVISALLSMQASDIGDPRLARAFADTQGRIQSMALVHQKLYQARDLSRINLKEYVSDLVDLATSTYATLPGQVRIEKDLDDVFVLIDTAIPCGLMLNELISNTLKYAFPGGRRGAIRICLRQTSEHRVELDFVDDGVGLPAGFDPRRDGHMGLQTLFVLAEGQLQGTISYETAHGTAYRVTFPNDLVE